MKATSLAAVFIGILHGQPVEADILFCLVVEKPIQVLVDYNPINLSVNEAAFLVVDVETGDVNWGAGMTISRIVSDSKVKSLSGAFKDESGEYTVEIESSYGSKESGSDESGQPYEVDIFEGVINISGGEEVNIDKVECFVEQQ